MMNRVELKKGSVVRLGGPKAGDGRRSAIEGTDELRMLEHMLRRC